MLKNRAARRASRLRFVLYSTFALSLAVLSHTTIAAQTVQPAPRQSPPQTITPQQQTPPARPRAASFNLNDYGVQVAADPRLLAVMGALDAAGFEAAPQGGTPQPFLQELRAANATLDEGLRNRLRRFYESNRLPATASPAQQAARYVSLAFALGDAPDLQAPARTDDLPGGVLEVLDFAPLVREYYAQAKLSERLPAYTQAAQAIGARLRPGVEEMLRTVLARFRVRPILTTIERVPVATPSAKDKKEKRQTYVERERPRRFQIVPDPLAVPGTVNLRVVDDDYFVVLPPNANPATGELRRAYIQFLVEPLVRRYNREIALRRVDLNQLLQPSTAPAVASGATPTSAPAQTIAQTNAPRPVGIFEAVERSLVAAVDARITEAQRVAALMQSATAKTGGANLTNARREIADARVAALADAYERGGVLAFYFAEQLEGLDASGFEVTNFIPDLINTFDPARERARLTENSVARSRAVEVERRRATERAAEVAEATAREEAEAENPNARLLARRLEGVEGLLKANNYPEAEDQLRALLSEQGGDARIFFALGQSASLGAQDATDEAVQAERLKRALANYRLAVQAASPETDKALLSRAHTAIGRIHAFLDQPTEATAAFQAAVKVGNVPGGSFNEAQAGLAKLRQP